MRCEPCDGFGMRLTLRAGEVRAEPCPHCGGLSVVSCCEGTERHAGVAGVEAPPFGQIIAFPRPDRPAFERRRP